MKLEMFNFSKRWKWLCKGILHLFLVKTILTNISELKKNNTFFNTNYEKL